ncbi:ABC transporter permease [Clostridiales bacterium COT073_COT-073]|nr:ABC transporter permease [Clostridiales bacterium COT073_COT-073]
MGTGLLLTSIQQGLIYAILAIGVFLTYKILDIADLSVEGSFPLGAFVFARFALADMNPVLGIGGAFVAGALAGLLTAMLFIKLKIKPLLSGILTLTILYSVNLRINGKANIPLFKNPVIFSNDKWMNVILLILIVLSIKIVIDLFLKTEIGYLLIATGDNEVLVTSLGENSNKYKIIGLALSNGLVAVAGSITAQMNGFADITMGSSIIVFALASIIIGDTILKSVTKIKGTTRAIMGAIIYQLIGGFAIDRGLPATDLKAATAIIVIIFIAINNFSPNGLKLAERK